MDDAQGGYLVTKYLLELGHKKIKGFFKADDMQGLERHKGYVKALQESGIAYDPDDVVWFHTEDRKVKPALMAKEMVQSGQLPSVTMIRLLFRLWKNWRKWESGYRMIFPLPVMTIHCMLSEEAESQR